MERNRDKALRAKDTALKKFISKDVIGAMKFALKAQNLYPELDGIQQMISTLDIHIAARNRVGREYDWYRILGVDPRADVATVRKQYRKLALNLHPDKNKSVGAEEAFNLVSQAWSSLSDKGKKFAYDQMRNAIKMSQKVPATNGGGPPRANGFHNSNRTASSSAGTYEINGRPGQHVHKQKVNTFWTVCHRCKTQYEYLRVYLNHNLLCPNCHKAFFAVEIAPPPSNVRRSSKNQNHSLHNRNQAAHNANSKGLYSEGGSSSAASMFHQTHTNVKRDREEGHAAMKREEALRRRTALAGSSKRKGSMSEMTLSKQGSAIGGSSGVGDPRSLKDSIGPDNREIIIQRAKTEILNKLKILSTVEEPERHEDQKDNKREVCNSVERMDSDGQTHAIERPPDLAIDVPSPDFHDFDMHRAESSFTCNQVWAIYDDVDGMPRRYALIHNVISSNPFKVEIRWLISRTNDHFDLLSWAAYGFPLVCGNFAVGKCEIFHSLSLFSHKVCRTKVSSGVIRILPRKGDVWALYRNWSPDWNELTASEDIQNYCLVEVLEDFDEEIGVAVVPLVKVAGYKAMFHHHLDFREVRQIPVEEMSRFSHYVPSFFHRGQEAPSAPKGCKELDPGATPRELLHVVAVAKEDILEIEDEI